MDVVVRYASGLPDTTVHVDEDVSVPHVLRNEIRSQYSDLSHRRLKLLYNGRLLSTDTTIKNLKSPCYVHCIIGDLLSDEEIAQENDTQPQRQTTTVHGFDRLTGFSQNDIAQLRQQFHQIYGENANTEMEDEWIDSVVGPNGANTAPIANNNINSTNNPESPLLMLLAVSVGFALGGLALLLILIDAGGIFGKRTKIAVISGIIVNISFAILKSGV